MKYLQVEIEKSFRNMSFADLSKLMGPEDVSELLDRLGESYTIPVKLQDGRDAVIRQDCLLTVSKDRFEVVLSTSIPVSAQIFVMAKSEKEAEQIVQRLLSQGKIKKTDIPNLQENMEAELQYWIEQTEPEDWQIEDVRPKLSG